MIMGELDSAQQVVLVVVVVVQQNHRLQLQHHRHTGMYTTRNALFYLVVIL